MLEEIKKDVYQANLYLKKNKLVILTWGNVSKIDPTRTYVVIKPSGIDYEKMDWNDMVVVDLNGKIIEGKLNPSSDTPTHLYLYKNFKNINSIVHTHSTYATSFAQSLKSIKPFGTTHADNFYGNILCTRKLTKKELENDYEKNTGKVIVETFLNIDYLANPGVLVANHGPFTWGTSCQKAVENSLILEEVAKIATFTNINSNFKPMSAPKDLIDKHYSRKHGANAYYGQIKK